MTTTVTDKYYLYAKETVRSALNPSKVYDIRWNLVAILTTEVDLAKRIALARIYKEELKVVKHVITENIGDEIVLTGVSKIVTWWRLKLAGLKL